jgi:hypothetical protein
MSPQVTRAPAPLVKERTVHERILVILLRLAGGFTVMAFLAMLLPVEWMAVTHRWLGLGELPRIPVVDYLTRSVAALYGFHGVLLLIISGNPVRYVSIVRYVGFMNVVLGGLLVAIDLHAGLPLLWTIAEGPPIAAFGIVVLHLSRFRIPDP